MFIEGMKCFIFCTFFISIILAPSLGSKVTIHHASQLVELFNSTCQVDVDLQNDIDMSTVSIFHPLCLKQDGTCEPYTGLFDGKGYSIKGLVMDHFGGMFCGVKGASFKDLVIDNSCQFHGEIAGSLTPYAFGSITVKGCVNHASVKGNQIAGGFVGVVQQMKRDDRVVFDESMNHGTVIGELNNAGGFIGFIENHLDDSKVRFSNCENFGRISSSSGTSCDCVCHNEKTQKGFLISNVK